ncbi:MoaD/ThiS family protein [Litoribacter populi]|uniref:MoaD/ThiS family protein n=1 Tax=Litoribacter populi TaxID=2598460 RepID=UPI00117E9899|nr:MoaD/ThiS family protein [Litoribacter populi]
MHTTNTKITILAFGVIAEKLGDKILILPQTEDTNQLKKELVSSYPELENLKFTISVNKKLATANTAISPYDEIALLPPFSGG